MNTALQMKILARLWDLIGARLLIDEWHDQLSVIEERKEYLRLKEYYLREFINSIKKWITLIQEERER